MTEEHGHRHSYDEAPGSIALNSGAKGNLQTTLRISGMDCADEVEALEYVLRPINGVRKLRVNLVHGKVTLLHDEDVSAEHLIAAIARTGLLLHSASEVIHGALAELSERAAMNVGRGD